MGPESFVPKHSETFRHSSLQLELSIDPSKVGG